MDQLKIEPELYSFFNTIHHDTNTIEECEDEIILALGNIADKVRLGDVFAKVTAPGTKVRKLGLNHSRSLYHYNGTICNETTEFTYSIPDGGVFSATVAARGEEPFSKEELNVIELLIHEVFLKFSRQNILKLLNQVLMTDLDTGASTLTALMKEASILIAQNKIENYDILFFNVHNFKYVNKVFEYSEGDIVLRNYVSSVKEELQDGEILTRLGGDNFVALIKSDHTSLLINHLQNFRLKHSDGKKERSFLFGITLGYSSLENIHSPRDLMSRASIAYQAARRLGAGSVIKYSEKIHQIMMDRQELISSFTYALVNNEFVVYYQPKVDIHTKAIYGAEALVRWIRKGEMISPAQFIPLLEEEGSICTLDYFVLEHVCEFLKKRSEQGLPLVCISVNFSRRHLEDEDLIEKTMKIIDKYGIDHKYIEIELTESNDFQNYEKIRTIVNGFRKYNISTSMDDFGTGFSSLNMIKEVNLNVIKIDKSLIPLDSEDPDKEKDVILFKNLVQLIHQLGKKAIAEGVETTKQLNYISQAGCNIVQGYIFDKPLPEDEFINRLKNGY